MLRRNVPAREAVLAESAAAVLASNAEETLSRARLCVAVGNYLLTAYAQLPSR